MANLLQRDEAELTGKAGIGAEAYEAFGQEAGVDKLATVEDFPDAFKPAGGAFLMCCVLMGQMSTMSATCGMPHHQRARS